MGIWLLTCILLPSLSGLSSCFKNKSRFIFFFQIHSDIFKIYSVFSAWRIFIYGTQLQNIQLKKLNMNVKCFSMLLVLHLINTLKSTYFRYIKWLTDVMLLCLFMCWWQDRGKYILSQTRVRWHVTVRPHTIRFFQRLSMLLFFT